VKDRRLLSFTGILTGSRGGQAVLGKDLDRINDPFRPEIEGVIARKPDQSESHPSDCLGNGPRSDMQGGRG